MTAMNPVSVVLWTVGGVMVTYGGFGARFQHDPAALTRQARQAGVRLLGAYLYGTLSEMTDSVRFSVMIDPGNGGAFLIHGAGNSPWTTEESAVVKQAVKAAVETWNVDEKERNS